MIATRFPSLAQRAADEAAYKQLVEAVNPLPDGALILWDKPLSQIPEGYVLCDGTNGTPDMRGKLLVGTLAGIDPGAAVEI